MASAEPTFPWIYDYEEEERRAGGGFIEKPLLRPVVPASLLGPTGESSRIVALVDSGCDHILAPLWLAETIGVEPDENREIGIQIGGQERAVRFADVAVRLYEPGSGPTDSDATRHLEWHCQVGFFLHWGDPPWLLILGQIGFFDQYTVTMSRLAQQLAIEADGEFDGRYVDQAVALPPSPSPRFRM